MNEKFEEKLKRLEQSVEAHKKRVRELEADPDIPKKPSKKRKSSESKALTDLAIRKAKPGEWLSDPQHRGLRAYKCDGGIASLWYRFRSLTLTDAYGRPVLDSVKLGIYPAFDLASARVKWRELKIGRGIGIDPKSAATRQKLYVTGELCEDYVNGYAKKIKKSWRNDARILEKDVIPRLGDRPANISRTEAKELLTEVATRGDEAATQLLAVCRKAWAHAIEGGHVTVNPFLGLKVVNGVVLAAGTKVRKEKKSKAWWDDIALQAFLRWLPTSPLPVRTQHIALIQLYTGCRPGEVCGMTWDEVDFKRRTWTIPPERHKAAKQHMVPLCDQAIALLKSQPKVGQFVFPSMQDDRRPCRRGWYNDVWKKYAEAAPVHYITPHGLRHSVITGVAKMRCPPEVATRIAGHASTGITETVYTHHERDEEAREWLQKWANHLDALTADNFTALVR